MLNSFQKNQTIEFETILCTNFYNYIMFNVLHNNNNIMQLNKKRKYNLKTLYNLMNTQQN